MRSRKSVSPMELLQQGILLEPLLQGHLRFS